MRQSGIGSHSRVTWLTFGSSLYRFKFVSELDFIVEDLAAAMKSCAKPSRALFTAAFGRKCPAFKFVEPRLGHRLL
jgi:hypothetical protein